jgi:hypothetical protein
MSTEVAEAPKPTPAPKRRRWWRRLLLVLLVLLSLLLALPYAVALGPVRAWIEGRAAQQLGAACRIESLSFSWWQGLSVAGLEIANPPGFTSERASVRVRGLTVDVVPSTSVGGTVRVDGLEVFVEQDADGTTNLQRLGGPAAAPAPTDGGGTPTDAAEPSAMAIDVAVQNGRVEVRREGQLLEVADDVACTVLRAHGSPRLRIVVAADLSGGRTSLELEHDQNDGTLRGELTTPGLQLARWQPLVQTFLPGQVTALAGTVDGALQIDYRPDGSLVLGGTMAVEQPKLGGPLVGGLLLGGSKWTLTPALALGPRGAVQSIDARAVVVDLGWLQVRGKEPEPAPDGAAPRLAFHCDLDLAALAAFDPSGDVLPPSLRGSGARVTGDVTIPTAELPTDAAGWARAVAAVARLDVPRLAVAGFEFADVGLTADLRGGACELATADTTRLDGGPLSLTLRVDLRELDTLPTTASLRWQGGALHGGTTKVLRYAMPLLAGLDGAGAALSGNCDLELSLAGPAFRSDGQGWLAWLDAWRGNGLLGLRDAAFTPTAALQGLLSPLGPLSQGTTPLGDRGRLRIDSFAAPFEFAAGAVRTTAGEWLSKGQRIGLAGSVRLDGALDYQLDLTALLRGHRDGERVLKLLSGALPPAAITGSLDAPKLALPQLDNVLQKLLQGEGKQQVESLLKKALDDLLQKK